MDEKDLPEFIARLPAHLRFFFEDPAAGLDAEQLIQFTHLRLANVRRYRDELTAHGIAADRFLAHMEPVLQNLEKQCARVEKAEDALLQAQADSADAQYDLFRHCAKVVEAMEDVKPFDPDVQELREQLDELGKNFPKE